MLLAAGGGDIWLDRNQLKIWCWRVAVGVDFSFRALAFVFAGKHEAACEQTHLESAVCPFASVLVLEKEERHE